MRKTMKHIVAALLCMLLLPLTLAAQTNKTIKELEKQREQLYGQIEENKSLLNTTKKNAENQMSQLAVISAQIEERKKYINKLNKDITAVDKEITIVEKQLRQLEKELKDTKEKYKTSVKQIRKKNKIQDKLLFIFSADNLAGEPVYISVSNSSSLPLPVEDGKKKKKSDGVIYNIPGKGQVDVSFRGKTKWKGELQFAQFGYTEVLVDGLFDKKVNTRVVFNPTTGCVVKIDKD